MNRAVLGIEQRWKQFLEPELKAEYFIRLKKFIAEEKKLHTIYPPKSEVFNAFNLTPFDKIKVVIIGQDPYHGPRQAHGLCFSVKKDVPIPRSLANIFKELHNDVNITIPEHGNLEHWAKQGVLLLNATLTVRASQAGSHQKKGWEQFTDAAIKTISEHKENIIFLLWGRFAQDKAALIDSEKHHILKAAHPSPFSAYNGFFGCKHFSEANELLRKMNKGIIDWQI